MHDGDPIAHADHFLHVAGDHQDGHSGVGQVAQHPIDLALGTDVDATCRLVANEHARVHRQPLGQHDLLLVATRQRPRVDLHARRTDRQFLFLIFGNLERLGFLDEPPGGTLRKIGQQDVFADRLVEQQAATLAVFRHQEDTALDGITRRRELDLLATERERTCDQLVDAGQGAREFSAARADQSGHAQDLPAPQGQGDCMPGVRFGLCADDVQHAVAWRLGRRHVECLEVAADHQADHRRVRDLVFRQFADDLSITQYDDPVGTGGQFVQAVRDEDDAHALGLQVGDDPHQAVRFGQRQAGRRLVHDDQARVQRKRFRDFQQLALRDRQLRHECVRRKVHSQRVEVRARQVMQLLAIDQLENAAVERLATDEGVGRRIEVLEEVEFLVDEGDSSVDRIGHRQRLARSTVDMNDP